MSVLEKLAKEARGKKNKTYVQVEVPTDTHEQLSKILAKDGITWQKLLSTFIEETLSDFRKKSS